MSREQRLQMRETSCKYPARTADASRTWMSTCLCHDACENVKQQKQHRSVKLSTTWVRATSVLFLGSVWLGRDVFCGRHSGNVAKRSTMLCFKTQKIVPFENQQHVMCKPKKNQFRDWLQLLVLLSVRIECACSCFAFWVT